MKEICHPNAFLSNIRNNKRGVGTRTRILVALDRHPANVRALSGETGLPYGVVLHHLMLLMAEDVVERGQRRPHIWVLTGLGQKRLVNSS